ncbi:MAG: hypothetical protein A3G81_11190 [Betaproteobacteria bacterium RIFCSPLOWO2_12_FULL_65_14]|nr:MAG: hypothetical protein A3G81_11190 [Betaproteobacteria bacterium RIFCSPLOWO2_12_FULL_65_14]
MGRGKQDKIKLPTNWWPHLLSFINSKWQYPDAPVDVYKFTSISPRSIQKAKKSNLMTVELFVRLAHELGFDNYEDLLRVLGGKTEASRLVTPIPTSLSLTTQRVNPQWADYRDYTVRAARPWALRCQIATESPYFRFGFKLLGEDGRVFGDGSIKSHDANMIVHIGRNNWDRPALGITAHDIFLTAYMSGNFVEENDRFLFRSEAKLVAPIELQVDRSYCVSLVVNSRKFFRSIVPPPICRRVVVYAWGDREEFRVDVTDLAIK